MTRFPAALLLVFVLGCGGGAESSTLEQPDETSGEEQEPTPAEEVVEEDPPDRAQRGELGESYVIDNDLVITVSSIELNPTYVPGEPWQATHLVSVRVENPTGYNAYVPDMIVHCENYGFGGGYMADSTIQPSEALPAETFREGVLAAHLPAIDGVAVNDCVNPVLRVSLLGFETPISVDFPIQPLPVT